MEVESNKNANGHKISFSYFLQTSQPFLKTQSVIDSSWQGLHMTWHRFKKQVNRKLTYPRRNLRCSYYLAKASSNRWWFELQMVNGEDSLSQECLTLLQSSSAIDESLNGTVEKRNFQHGFDGENELSMLSRWGKDQGLFVCFDDFLGIFTNTNMQEGVNVFFAVAAAILFLSRVVKNEQKDVYIVCLELLIQVISWFNSKWSKCYFC